MSKRTHINFSKHEHRREIFKSEDGNEIIVDHLQIGRSRCGYFKFINSNDNLSVTGDYGNWIFCRPFVPHPEESVSEGYWCEKLSIYSIQEPYEYDADATRKSINKFIESGLEDYGYEDEELEEIKEWFTELLDCVDSEHEYLNKTVYNYDGPRSLDVDYIPHDKTMKPRLNYIFDAFEEICNRLGKAIPEIKIDPTTRTVEMELIETNVEIITYEPTIGCVTITKEMEEEIINKLNLKI